MKAVPAQLTGYGFSSRLGLFGFPQFIISGNNISDKVIKSFCVTLFGFNEENLPVLVFFGTDGGTNFNYYGKLLSPGETFSIKEEMIFDLNDTSGYPQKWTYAVREVEFFDGTTWENPLYDSLYDKYKNHTFEERDSNILLKS